MKLITLNTWGGRYKIENLLQFLKDQNADIFCLQEVWNGGEKFIRKNFPEEKFDVVQWNLLSKVASALPGYQFFFRPHYLDFYGPAIFLKKDILVEKEGDIFVYEQPGFYSQEEVGDHARNIQYIQINTFSGKRTIVNFHGIWDASGKQDTPTRLVQSEKILKFLKTIDHPFIFCGDFNLTLNSESIQKFEQFGLQNLVREAGVTSTRTSLYLKQDRFADYIFVSNGIKIADFRVLPDEVSDHTPLYLEYE